jgi:hypothetical protein
MMKKLIVLVSLFALALAFPAFAATAGPQAADIAIDQAPLAGAVEISQVVFLGEKEVSAPLGRSTAYIEKCVNVDLGNGPASNSIYLCKYSSISIGDGTAREPPGYYLLV